LIELVDEFPSLLGAFCSGGLSCHQYHFTLCLWEYWGLIAKKHPDMGNSGSRHNKRVRWSFHRSLSAVQTLSPKSGGNRTSTEIKHNSNSTTIAATKTTDMARNTQNETHEPVDQHPLVKTSQSDSAQPPSPASQKSISRTSDVKIKEIANPTAAELLFAAVKFGEAARKSSLTYAIVGGVSALIFGSMRPTSQLDVLYVPNASGPLFDHDPSIFGYRSSNDENPIVLIYQDEGFGIQLNLINLRDTQYGFPDLHGPILSDSSASDDSDTEPTWDYYSIRCEGKKDPVAVRVLLPRLLLQQRLLKFPTREGEKDPEERKKKDILDIATYLKALFGTLDQSFKSKEVDEFIDNAREVMRFAEKHGISGGLDVASWRWIMIPLVEGDWREVETS